MESSDSTKSRILVPLSRRLWLSSILIPFAAFFAIGARFGWWFIEKDAGRLLRDTGRVVDQHDFLEAAFIYGLLAGTVGALLGICVYGLFVLVKRSKPS